MSDILFTGEAQPTGGLSNEDELAVACPPEFDSNNPWAQYAERLFYLGADISSWEYTDETPDKARPKLLRLHALLGSFELDQDRKFAVAGWMLSIMLSALPEFVPLPPEENQPPSHSRSPATPL